MKCWVGNGRDCSLGLSAESVLVCIGKCGVDTLACFQYWRWENPFSKVTRYSWAVITRVVCLRNRVTCARSLSCPVV